MHSTDTLQSVRCRTSDLSQPGSTRWSPIRRLTTFAGPRTASSTSWVGWPRRLPVSLRACCGKHLAPPQPFMRECTSHRGALAAGRAPLPGTDFWRRTSVRLKTGAWLETESTLATLPRQGAAPPQHRQNRQYTLRLSNYGRELRLWVETGSPPSRSKPAVRGSRRLRHRFANAALN